MTLWYLPIEPYEERYTKNLDKWVEMELVKNGIDYKKISPPTESDKVLRGQVLDSIGRPLWCIEQTRQLLKALSKGELKNGDKIFTMDIWQFAIETLFYASNPLNINLEFYGFNCAGSFEWYDFINLSGIGLWGKHLEKTWFTLATKVFFASEKLRSMALNANMFSDPRKAVVTGHALNSDYILDLCGFNSQFQAFNSHKEKNVVFPHRYDFEKNPDIFLDVAEELQDQGINFIVTTGRGDLTGTANYKRALRMEKEGKIKIYKGMLKSQYYRLLLNSSIIFSSAKQDTIGNCILEAITLGCTPVVNTGVSYDEYLPRRYMYTDGAVDEACDLILKYISQPSNTFLFIKRYNKSIENMLKEMGY